MATIIDALAVSLSLDPKQFQKGATEATGSMRKTREAAVREGQGIEKAMDKAGESLERLARNALRLFAIFTTGRAVKDFISDITASDAALGRLAKSLETTPEALSSLGNAVARSGGSADAAVGSFQKLANAYNEVKLTGRSATYDMLSRLAGASGQVIRFGKDTQKTIYDTADAAKALTEKSGLSFTTNLLEQAGFDPGTIALLVQGSAKVKEAQEKVRRLGGVITKQDTENAQRFSTALHDVGTISEGLGRTIWTSLSPAISEIIEKVIKWYEVNGEWLRSQIAEKVQLLADYLRSIDWNAIGRGIRDFALGANEAAKAVGGWKVVFEALLGAWLFTKLFALLRVLGLIRLAITGAATPGIFGSLLAALGIGGTATVAAAVGTAVAADKAVPNAEKPALTNHWDDDASGAAGGAGAWSAMKRLGRRALRAVGIGGGGGGSGSGSGDGSRSWRNNNPGNIKDGAFARRMGATGTDSGGFARFPDYATGRKAQESLLFESDNYKNLTIAQAIARWAPGSDGNDPAGYAAQMAKAAGVGTDTKLSDLTPEQRGRFLDAQQRKEGWIPGARQVAGSVPPVNGAGGVDQRQGDALHRKQPITDVLSRQISAAATAAGVNAEVFSGGQSENGPDHYGSHRHDHGQSADLKLYTIGPNGQRRYLDMTNEADRVVMEKFIRESVKAGANGVGAGPGYMGGRTNMHVGGGSPMTWGAGGSSANAPEWLRRAHQQGMEDRLVAAAAAAKAAREAPKPPSPAAQKSSELDAARRAGATAAVAQANAAQAAVVSRTVNDNRSPQDNRRWEENHLHNVNIYPPEGTGHSIMDELRKATTGNKAVAAAADYGRA